MSPILYLLLITIGGGILALVRAITSFVFFLVFVGCLVRLMLQLSKWRKDLMVQRSMAAEWMQRAASRAARKSSNETPKE